MATRDEVRARIAAFARQLAEAELAEIDDSDSVSWLDAVEARAVEIGDEIVTELVKVKVAGRPIEAEESICSQCGQPGRYKGTRQRPLLTRRGSTTISEPVYHCPACRRDFFPDDPRDRG